MALYFNESQIDEFKECFFYHAKKGYVANEDDLSIIMRSLSYGVTKEEVRKYFTKAKSSSDDKIDFASFLNIMQEHSKVENPQSELRAALRAQDRDNMGYVPASELKHILTSVGEKLSSREVDSLLREAGVQPHGKVNIQDFVETIMTPSPDY